MKNYTGTKHIKAESMTRLDYNIYRNWTIPADEDPLDEGYHVLYLDSKDDKFESGFYESWSPKDVFERSYIQNENLTVEDINEELAQLMSFYTKNRLEANDESLKDKEKAWVALGSSLAIHDLIKVLDKYDTEINLKMILKRSREITNH
tara:strand:- start:654 stop:1100 length:447 start_codon:yes stop_codon:yes gene_type:complete